MKFKWYRQREDPLILIESAAALADKAGNKIWRVMCQVEKAKLLKNKDRQLCRKILFESISELQNCEQPSLLSNIFWQMAEISDEIHFAESFHRQAISVLYGAHRELESIPQWLSLGRLLLNKLSTNKDELVAITDECFALMERPEYIDRHPYFQEAALLFADIVSTETEIIKAVRLLEKVVEERWGLRHSGDFDFVWYKLGNFHFKLGNFTASRECFKTLFESYRVRNSRSNDYAISLIDVHQRLAEVYFALGYPNLSLGLLLDAEQHLTDWDINAPLDHDVNLQCAEVLLSMRQFEEAETRASNSFEAVFDRKPLYKRCLRILARCAFERGEAVRALSYFSQAHAVMQSVHNFDDDEVFDSYASMALCLISSGRDELGFRLMKSLFDESPIVMSKRRCLSRARIHFEIGMLYKNRLEIVEARRSFVEAICLSQLADNLSLLLEIAAVADGLLTNQSVDDFQRLIVSVIRSASARQQITEAEELRYITQTSGRHRPSRSSRREIQLNKETECLASKSHSERNSAIIRLTKCGFTQIEIARKLNLSTQRISQIVKNPKTKVRVVKSNDQSSPVSNIADPLVRTLAISARVKTALRAAKVRTLSDLLGLAVSDLDKIKGLGPKGIEELKIFRETLSGISLTE